MGLLDSLIGGVLGGGGMNSPLRAILAGILSGQAATGPSGATSPGLGGLLERFTQAGHGDVANSWVSSGPNQPISPDALQHVFGREQVDQWSQQTGMPQSDLLHQLSQFLPQAVDSMTPNGQVQEASADDPFQGPGRQ